MGKIKSSVQEEPNDAFTSMIDIVFLLLIFFILQPFKEPEVMLKSELPKDAGGPPKPDVEPPRPDIKIRLLVVRANPNDAKIFVDNERVGYASGGAAKRLASILIQKRGGDSDEAKKAPVAILPSSNIHFKHVLDALDQCYKAEMPNVKFGFGNSPN